MKLKICSLLITVIFSFLSFSQVRHDQKFNQEIAEIFTVDDGLPEVKFTRIYFDKKGDVKAVSEDGSFKYDGEKWSRIKSGEKDKAFVSGKKDQVEAEYKRVHYVGNKNGLFIKNSDGNLSEVFPADGNYSWKLNYVTVLAVDTKGRLWFGSDEGAGYLKDGKWKLFTGKEGLPFKYFTSSAVTQDGEIWFGTIKGAIRTDREKFHYRFSRRWLPDDHINDIEIDDAGNVWFATNKGIARISNEKMTFDSKAAWYTNQVETRHNRMGFIAQNYLTKRYDPKSFELDISDNDGLYTSWYGSAQAFRYAVTKDPEAKKLAKRSFKACKWLVDITHEKGFPARVIIPVDWRDPVNEQYDHEYNINKQQEDPFWKDITPRFPKSKDGKYLWKCDTSSDELSGHYFFYGIYFDLVAETEEEKDEVREVVRDITDHLIRHGFKLVDHDGKPTRWANFSPEYFDSVWGWDQKGLNSLEMLSFLNVAYHVTGDRKYYDTAKMLRNKYNYHINAMQAKMYFPPEDVVPWDNNLCLMSFYGLLNYEEDPELILMYRESLENAWLHISNQKNAFWNGLYAAMAMKFNRLVDTGIYDSGRYFPEAGSYASFTAKQYYKTDFKMDDNIEMLEFLPLDLIGYEMDNRHRLDIVFDPTPGLVVQDGWRPVNPARPDNTFEIAVEQKGKRGWHATDNKSLPVDERCYVRLDRDGMIIDSNEGDGYTENEGTIYLLPYYLLRYHKLID